MEASGLHHATVGLAPRKEEDPLDKKMDEPKRSSGHNGEDLSLL
jgi:hypothetical protein